MFNLKTDPSHVIASPTSCEEHAFGMMGVAIQQEPPQAGACPIGANLTRYVAPAPTPTLATRGREKPDVPFFHLLPPPRGSLVGRVGVGGSAGRAAMRDAPGRLNKFSVCKAQHHKRFRLTEISDISNIRTALMRITVRMELIAVARTSFHSDRRPLLNDRHHGAERDVAAGRDHDGSGQG